MQDCCGVFMYTRYVHNKHGKPTHSKIVNLPIMVCYIVLRLPSCSAGSASLPSLPVCHFVVVVRDCYFLCVSLYVLSLIHCVEFWLALQNDTLYKLGRHVLRSA